MEESLEKNTVKIMQKESLQRYFWRKPWIILGGIHAEISGGVASEITGGILEEIFLRESR